MRFGGHSEVAKIERVIIKHARDAFVSQDQIDAQFKELNYSGRPDFAKAVEESKQFVELLRRSIPEVLFLPRDHSVGLDSLYVRDAMLSTNKGIILCNMGKALRRPEPLSCAGFLVELSIPVLGSITGEGRLEGGDIIWIDDQTLVVGRGYRTNDEGIRQLRELTSDIVTELVVVPLPHWSGPTDVLHLMSFISPIDYDLALVYSRLMPVPFREWLLGRRMKLVEVPDSEYESMACNVLAVAPRKCIMLTGNDHTRRLLEDEGVEVWQYAGDEISRKGAGGPTCLTRPVLRA